MACRVGIRHLDHTVDHPDSGAAMAGRAALASARGVVADDALGRRRVPGHDDLLEPGAVLDLGEQRRRQGLSHRVVGLGDGPFGRRVARVDHRR